jgi:plasmid stability protein
MTNLTISLDETIIRQARIRAIGEGTSVSAKVREFLAQYAGVQPTATPPKSINLPVYSGGTGLAPGIDPSSNKSYLEAMGD